jgi:23S rRNA (adenine2030-N6)-methyltransferase
LNYRHHFHAGNFADVMKHALLVQLARSLQRKPGGFLYLDTHAGRGSYVLGQAKTGDTRPRLPEYPEGIGRLWPKDNLPPALADYVELVRQFNSPRPKAPTAAPVRYPGSPCLIQMLARPQDRLVLNELNSAEATVLRKHLRDKDRVTVRTGDGYAALRAFLPPLEKRALVHIDPPFEAEDEGEKIVQALGEALPRFPNGIYAIWYPLAGRVKVADFFDRLRKLPLPPTLVADIIVEPNAPRMNGCGLAILNPPWDFEQEARPMLRYLAGLLSRGPGSNSTVRWLVPAR